MAVIKRSALVPYTSDEMYGLVDDIRSYPLFLPWCKAATEECRDDNQVRATIELQKGALRKSFTTQNRMQKGKIIEMKLVHGPFSHLEGYWLFNALGDDACKVTLDLHYEFSNRIIKMAIGPVFDHIANSLVEAFCARAKDIYGAR